MWTKDKRWVDSPCEYHISDNVVEYELEIWKDKRKRKQEIGEGEMMYKMNMIMIDAIIKDLSYRLVNIKKRQSDFEKKRVRKYVTKSTKREYYL